MMNVSIGRLNASQRTASLRFQGAEDGGFSDLSAVDQFKVTLFLFSRNKVRAVREAILDACLDAMKLETAFNILPHFKNSLASKNVIGATLVKEAMERATALDTPELVQMIGKVILERAKNETDPALKAKAEAYAPTVRALFGES